MIKNQKIIFQKQVECGQHMQQINIVACVMSASFFDRSCSAATRLTCGRKNPIPLNSCGVSQNANLSASLLAKTSQTLHSPLGKNRDGRGLES